MKIVSFEWKDAFGNSGWFDQDETKKVIEDVDLWVYSTGFLLKKTKRELIICTTWQPADETHRIPEKFCNIHKIPWTWIRNYRVLGHRGETLKKRVIPAPTNQARAT
ncbi:MAG: hypothetical protein PHU12_04210 [Candidatus Aenigmarchaeota archaeon]|nr:hypothetical protein [Candidatus Aenigmarchaeota archaeon]